MQPQPRRVSLLSYKAPPSTARPPGRSEEEPAPVLKASSLLAYHVAQWKLTQSYPPPGVPPLETASYFSEVSRGNSNVGKGSLNGSSRGLTRSESSLGASRGTGKGGATLKSILRPVGLHLGSQESVAFSTNPVTSTKFFLGGEPAKHLYDRHPGGERVCAFTLFRPDYTTPLLGLGGPPITGGAVSLFDSQLKGFVYVQNLAFEKKVSVRYSFDMWNTSTDAAAVYHSTPASSGGLDKFCWEIDLSDRIASYFAEVDDGNLTADRFVMHFALRYEVAGQDFWDNNGGANYQIHFIRHFVSSVVSASPHSPMGTSPLSPRSSFMTSAGLGSRYNFALTSDKPYVAPDLAPLPQRVSLGFAAPPPEAAHSFAPVLSCSPISFNPIIDDSRKLLA